MAKTLTINSIPYQYPTSGDEPGWGGPATDWASAVTDVLNNLLGPNDILQTSFDVANNQTSFANITGLVFDAASVRKASVDYAVSRLSEDNPSGFTEGGTIEIVYDNNAGWSHAIGGVVGNAGIYFFVTSLGQVQYKTTDIGDDSYVGVITFTAKCLNQ